MSAHFRRLSLASRRNVHSCSDNVQNVNLTRRIRNLTSSLSQNDTHNFAIRATLQSARHPQPYKTFNVACAPLSTSSTFSTSAATTQQDGTSSNDTNKDKNDKGSKEKKDDSNFLLDNLGKIFLAVIATIIGTLVRSSYNTSNRNDVRDSLEEFAAIDPVEIDDLRIANSELTPEVFRIIMKDLHNHFPNKSTCSYNEFVFCVRRTMRGLKGDAFTIQLGHLLDRVVLAILEKYNKSSDDSDMPLALWLTLLSLALNSDASERIKVLFEVLQNDTNSSGGDYQYVPTLESESNESAGVETLDSQVDTSNKKVTIQQIRSMVGYLQETFQLVPDNQVVAIEDKKYPTQQFERGKPKDLVPWDGPETEQVDLDAFALILRSKSVCVWGECYHRRKFS